ncbi:hypothetical protein LC55x_3252 [Lysobacter capsici]|nr:hypothetical protein LC55x_3252 [Lysobacter capsici]
MLEPVVTGFSDRRDCEFALKHPHPHGGHDHAENGSASFSDPATER